MLKRRKKKHKPSLKLRKAEIVALARAANSGNQQALRRLEAKYSDPREARFIDSVTEELRAERLRGYKGVNHGEPRKFRLWPYRK